MKLDKSLDLQPYFDHVLAEYDLLASNQNGSGNQKAAPVPPRIAEILSKCDKDQDREQLTWGDLYELEKYVLERQSDEAVGARAPGLRENFREVVGQRHYEAYLQSHPPQPRDPATAKALRADLGRLLDVLHWAYSMVPKREQLRSTILRNIGVAMITFIAASLVFYAVYLHNHPVASIMGAVALMGALGGFVSLQERIQKIPGEGDPILTIFQLQSGVFSLYLAPLSGAIFATLLLFVFTGGLISGNVFPSIKGEEFYGSFYPTEDAANFGKLMVWSFIAGFAERFVPDTLTGLVNKAQRAPAPATMITAGTEPPNGAQKAGTSKQTVTNASKNGHGRNGHKKH